MIGNITSGTGARGALNYVMGEEKQAEYIGGTMAGETARELAAEFKATRQMKPDAVNPVKHYSLSLPPGERLSSEKWQEIANGYMKGMGYEKAQWVAFRHSDKDHDHIHMVASRIRLDGSLVHEGRDRYKSQDVLRELEREHGLTIQPSSKDREVQSKQATQGEAKFESRTGRDDASTRKELQGIVSEAMKDNPTMTEFVNRLESRGVSLKANLQSTGRISGLTYQINDRVMKGSDLGKSFTAAGIQKFVSYDPKRDLAALTGERTKAHEASKPEIQKEATFSTDRAAAKEAWDEAKAHREAMQDLSKDAREVQAALSDELKAAMAGKKALAQERWNTVKPLKGVARNEAWERFEPRIQKQTDKIQTIKLDQAVTRSTATTKRMDLMEGRYRAELRAVNATYEKGTKDHSRAMEKAGTAFLREAKGYAETLRKGVEGRIDRAAKGTGKVKRAPSFYVDKDAQRIEAVKGAGRVAQEAIKGGWKALSHQAEKAKELYRTGKAAVTEKTPEAWKAFQSAWKESRETFKQDLREARAAVKEARSLTVERVKDKAERTRPEALEMRAERVIREQSQAPGGTQNVGAGRREDRGQRAEEARPERGEEQRSGERTDPGQRAGDPRGGAAGEPRPGTHGGGQSRRDGSPVARGGDDGRGLEGERPGAEAARGESPAVQRDASGIAGRERDLDRGAERGGMAQAPAGDTQGRGGRDETPAPGSAGSRDQGREGGQREGQGVPSRGSGGGGPEQHDKRPDRVEPRREGPGEGGAAARTEGTIDRATTQQQAALKQYGEMLKGGGSEAAPDRVKVPYNMKRLEERIHAANDALKAQGLKTPFTKDALTEAGPQGVEKVLDAYEKAGLHSGTLDKAELGALNKEQTKVMKNEREGPELQMPR